MTQFNVTITLDIATILLSIFIVIRSIPLIKNGKKPMTVALFLFATVCFMLSITYWLTYTLIRPDTRMPFAANEIGEIAMSLLFASVLEAVFSEKAVPAKKELFFTGLFSAASVVLWICWSGEWFEDIFFGLAFGFFLCTCVRSLKQTDAMARNEWITLGLSCFILILAQAGTLVVPESIKKPLDLFCYALMFSVLIWLLVKTILMLKNGKDGKAVLALSFGVWGYGFSTLYMSSEWFYIAAFTLCLAVLPLMFLALRREVTE